MKTEVIGILKDNQLNCNYSLIRVNAIELSNLLKKNLKDMNIDYNHYIINKEKDTQFLMGNPPMEIYEYQNMFILEDTDNKLLLLDGFRRLLWYNAPDIDITVRVYQKTYLSDKHLLQLMLNLNHFKFYGISSYYDRGFALFMSTIFGVDITSFPKAFNSYLMNDKTVKDYGSDKEYKTSTDEINAVKSRIMNDHFISDIKFIKSLNDAGLMVNSYTGSLVYKLRCTTNEDFDSKKIIEYCNNHTTHNTLLEKYNQVGLISSEKSKHLVNQLIQIYIDAFDSMQGKIIPKTHSELTLECSAMLKELNKDKSYVKVTGNKFDYLIEGVMKKRLKENIPLNFKVLVYPPHIDSTNHSENAEIGIYTDVKFDKFIKSGYMGRNKMSFDVEINGRTYTIGHNFEGTHFAYIRLKSSGRETNKIALFVDVTKEEIDYFDKHRGDLWD